MSFRVLFSRLLPCALVFAVLVAAWDSVSASSDEWLPVSPDDLVLKAPKVEPGADAEAIFWDIRIDDGGESDLVLSHYVRIKIFTERGREQQSKIEIPFFKGRKIKDVAARTIKPDGSTAEVAKADIIEKEIVNLKGFKLKSKTFAFAGIQPGAIIEYKWKEVLSNTSANYLRLPFQRDIPIQSVTYRIKPSGSQLFDVLEFNMPKPYFEKEAKGFYAATVTKMPAFQEEPLMPPKENVRSWAMIRYVNIFSFLRNYYMQASGAYSAFEPYTKVNNDIKRKAAEITSGASTPEEKVEKIFAFCRTQIKNTDSKTSGLSDEQIEKLKENKKPTDTLKRGVGSGFDVNLLFAALVNGAGLKARLALLADREDWLFNRNEFIPGILRGSNIAVQVGTIWKFYDPGHQYVTMGMLRWQEEGVEAMIADENPLWVKTPLSGPEKSQEKRVATLRLDEDGTLEGDVTIEFTGHLGVERKVLNEDDSPFQQEETLKEVVKSRLGAAELSNIVIENATDPNKPFVYKYHIRVPNFAERTGKRLFLQPGYFHKGIPALFAASMRRYPIYFHFPWSEEDNVTIELPKGFVLDNADRPPPIRVGAICQHEISMGLVKDLAKPTLGYSRKFLFGGAGSIFFPASSYQELKRLFDEVHRADNHVITLKSE